MDPNGNVVVRYEYNAWGKLLNITGSLAGTVGVKNPFRYRGYYYDTETGLYYLKSRFYDPGIGRFISADGYISTGQGVLGTNMFAYCLNNPVNRIDESGSLSISILAKGASLVATGLVAIGVAAAVVTCGVATPVMLGVAVITMGAGALTTINGASDIGESISGHNVVRDTVFKGNAKAYNAYSAITTTVSAVGSIACGGWLAANKPRISAYNNIQDYNYTNTISDAEHMKRVYNNSVLLQKQIIKYGKMTKDSEGFGYIFTASGAVNKTIKMWRLGVNVAKRLVWHFGHGF